MTSIKPGYLVVVANTHKGLWLEHYTGAATTSVFPSRLLR